MYAVGLAVIVLTDQYVKLSLYTNIGTSAGAISTFNFISIKTCYFHNGDKWSNLKKST